MKRWCWLERAISAAVAMILLGAMTGCGSGDSLPREPVSGRVTLDGEPLTKAWIEFRPAGKDGVTASGAMIIDGSYSVSRKEGLIPGDYRVLITKAEEPGEANVRPDTGAAPKSSATGKKSKKGVGAFGFAKQLIPARYNVKSELTAKVEAGRRNGFDYPLVSK